MNDKLKPYEAVFLGIIYLIIVLYSVKAMASLIMETDDASSLLKVIIMDTFWLTLIVVLGALLTSVIFTHKRRRR